MPAGRGKVRAVSGSSPEHPFTLSQRVLANSIYQRHHHPVRSTASGPKGESSSIFAHLKMPSLKMQQRHTGTGKVVWSGRLGLMMVESG